MGWPEAIAAVALAVIVVAIVALVRGQAIVAAWARHAYSDDDD